MSGTGSIDVALGAAMPLLVALVNQAHWSPARRGIVAMVLCVLAAFVASVVRGADWTQWRATTELVVGTALVTYSVFWKPSTIAPVVEAATTIGAGAPVR
jgi:hypothetical protein